MVLTHVKKTQLVITPLVGTTALVILVSTEMKTIALVSYVIIGKMDVYFSLKYAANKHK